MNGRARIFRACSWPPGPSGGGGGGGGGPGLPLGDEAVAVVSKSGRRLAGIAEGRRQPGVNVDLILVVVMLVDGLECPLPACGQTLSCFRLPAGDWLRRCSRSAVAPRFARTCESSGCRLPQIFSKSRPQRRWCRPREWPCRRVERKRPSRSGSRVKVRQPERCGGRFEPVGEIGTVKYWQLRQHVAVSCRVVDDFPDGV